MPRLRKSPSVHLLSILLAVLILGMMPYGTRAAEPDRIAILMYADWCGSCKILDPKLKAVQPEFERSDILFVRFDLTNDATKHQSRLLAQALGLGEVYEMNGGKTGHLVIVDRASGQSIDRVTKNHSEAEIRASLRRASDG